MYTITIRDTQNNHRHRIYHLPLLLMCSSWTLMCMNREKLKTYLISFIILYYVYEYVRWVFAYCWLLYNGKVYKKHSLFEIKEWRRYQKHIKPFIVIVNYCLWLFKVIDTSSQGYCATTYHSFHCRMYR